jgi:hypothetical protein
MGPAIEDLPFVDEHRVLTSAPADVVWERLLVRLARADSSPTRAYGRLVGVEPRRASGRLPAVGATLPGFAVAEVDPMRLLRLTGRHRFSRYAWTFTLEPTPSGTRVVATTHAKFPGALGRLYRGAVIGTGAHQILVRRLLRSVARRRPPTD